MGETVKVDELLVELRLRAEAMEQGLADAQHKLAEFAEKQKKASEQAAKQTEEATKRAAEKVEEAAKRAADKAEAAAKKAAEKTEAEAARAAEKAEAAAKKAADKAEAEAARAAEKAAAEAKQAAEKVKAEADRAALAVSAAAGVALAGIVSAAKDAIAAASEYKNAIKGLSSIAEGTGQDMTALKAAVTDLTEDGLMPASDASTALKNLLERGFSADESIAMLKRLKDAASFGRQGTLSLGEAVRSAAEGIKNENSVLVDNAGVTKNVSVMWKEYAEAVGKSVNDLTLAEKRQAEYNGILAETANQAGDAAKYADSYSGAVSALEANQRKANQAWGDAMQSVLAPFVEQLSRGAGAAAEFAEQNPALVAGITATAVTGTAATAVFLGWKLAADKLRASLAALKAVSGGLSSTLGWVSLAVGVVGVLAAAAVGAKDSSEQVKELNAALQSASETAYRAESAFAVLQSGTDDTQKLSDATSQLAGLLPELVIGYDQEGKTILASNSLIEKRIALLKEEQQEAARAAQEAARRALDEKKNALDRAQGALDNTSGRIGEYEAQKAKGFTGNDGLLDTLYERQLAQQKALSDAALEYQTALEQLYGYQISALGELDETQALVAQNALEYAAGRQMSEEEFAEYLKAQLEDTDALARARRQLAEQERQVAQAAETTKQSFASLNAAMKDESGKKTVSECIDAMQDWRSSTDEVNDAAQTLAKTIGLKSDSILKNLDLIAAYVGNDEEAFGDLLDAEVKALGLSPSPDGVVGAIRQIIAAANDGSAAAGELVRVLEQLGAVKTVTVNSFGKTITVPTLPVKKSSSGTSGKKSSGGGGGSSQKAWEKELEELEHRSAMGEDVAQRQIAAMERILQKEKLTTEERRKLEEQLYSAKQALLQKELDARLALYSEIAALGEEEVAQRKQVLQELLSREDLTAEERRQTERELNELKLASDGDYLTDYLAHLDEQLQSDKLSAAQRQQVWEAYTDARIAQLARIAQAEEDGRAAAVDTGNRILSALRSRYQEERSAALAALSDQKSAATEAANAQIEAINAERDAQLKAIDEQIAALDALLAAKKQQKEDESDEDVLVQLKATLAYEKDEYNRTQLAQQIAAKENEIAEKKWERDIAAQKEALKEKQQGVRDEASSQTDALKKQLSAMQSYYDAQTAQAQAYYDQKLTNYSLVLETLELMQGEHEEEVQELLERYGKENITLTEALTDKLYRAFRANFENIVAEAERMSSRVQAEIQKALSAQKQLEQALQTGGSSGGKAGGASSSGSTTVNVRVSSEKGIQTAYEVKEQNDATGRIIAKKAGKVGG